MQSADPPENARGGTRQLRAKKAQLPVPYSQFITEIIIPLLEKVISDSEISPE